MDKPQTMRGRQGRDVLLSPERWQHIVQHPKPATAGWADMRLSSLENPDD